MFTNNLIDKINALKEREFNLFEMYAYQYQKDYLKKERLRKAYFRTQLHNFVSKKTTGINFDNLDAYLYAIKSFG